MRNREEAARAAENTNHNIVGACQMTVRNWFDAPSAGDLDKDGSADAEDGWKSEPISARHTDKVGKRGTPGAYLGGSADHGHRVMMLGDGIVRSTDFDGRTKRFSPGKVGTGTVDEVGTAMGVTWAGWSDTIDGVEIPIPPKPATRVSDARDLLKAAHDLARADGNDRRADRIAGALKTLPWR